MNLNRRDFLKQAGLLSAGALVVPNLLKAAQAPQKLPAPGLQLYTVRTLLDKDLKGTLQKVAGIGYKNMESAAGAKGHYYGLKPKEFTQMLADMGMKLRSSHVMVGSSGPKMPFETLQNDMQKLVDMAAESGQEYLTCAYLMPDERKTLDQYKKHIELFNKTDEACKKAGVKFAYHNHDFEFETLEGQVPYNMLLTQTKAKMELDLYWAVKSGNDPVGLFKKHPGRFEMWHVKDMDKTEKKFFTEVGNGVINFKPIFAAAKTAGLKYYYVEQDQTPGNPLDSITASYKNLTKILA
ncbi:sugar phosphate isomerase/epimerase family protein [Adhaeribacter rhizoryzae]|uniref:Sugar phosphate isomerase/epimerase n=1 Tax=Adhaeribacter rhizoryzae TaxID=2607907 RepID=A0A5M6D994_9BACT|nr:sugar phosphate isomerase/epimerase [Adhaeribacter rhizoryzae]KAA5542489.1 sugar phosphate isomerase/epimerase [Adhaeribacter rhizoryzae]